MQLTKQQLSLLIQEPYLSRGESYYCEGMVEITASDTNSVTARAIGTRLYSVQLYVKDGQLDGHCSCPAYSDYGPCKHMAAAGFAVIFADDYEPCEEFQYRMDELLTLEQSLMKKSKAELVSIIVEMVSEEPDLVDWLSDV